MKIGDFGLARITRAPLRPLSDNGVVVTIWCVWTAPAPCSNPPIGPRNALQHTVHGGACAHMAAL